MTEPYRDLIAEFCAAIGLSHDEGLRVRAREGACLPGRLPAGALAIGAVACVGVAATLGDPHEVVVEPARVSAAFRSDQLMRINDQPIRAFAPGSGYFPTAEGWIRTHANYPHHRAALLSALGLHPDADRDSIARALAELPALEVEERVFAAGGVAAALRTPAEWRRHPQGSTVAADPLLVCRPRATREDRPARVNVRPLRVLDFTRVIAGPVATRTLAWLGHDVLRVDPPGLPEIEEQHLDTGAGKRTTSLNAREAAQTLRGLIARADVVVLGYRPGALSRLGLDAGTLLERNPWLIVASLCAWGYDGPWNSRRGFDSVVQSATGIGFVEGLAGPAGHDSTLPQRPGNAGLERPGALAAQALDHATGYLLAAAVLAAAHRGGGYEIRLSLARTAQWLLDHQTPSDPQALTGLPDTSRFVVDRQTYAGRVRSPLPAIELPGVAPQDFPYPPRPFGTDTPEWT